MNRRSVLIVDINTVSFRQKSLLVQSVLYLTIGINGPCFKLTKRTYNHTRIGRRLVDDKIPRD